MDKSLKSGRRGSVSCARLEINSGGLRTSTIVVVVTRGGGGEPGGVGGLRTSTVVVVTCGGGGAGH